MVTCRIKYILKKPSDSYYGCNNLILCMDTSKHKMLSNFIVKMFKRWYKWHVLVNILHYYNINNYSQYIASVIDCSIKICPHRLRSGVISCLWTLTPIPQEQFTWRKPLNSIKNYITIKWIILGLVLLLWILWYRKKRTEVHGTRTVHPIHQGYGTTYCTANTPGLRCTVLYSQYAKATVHCTVQPIRQGYATLYCTANTSRLRYAVLYSQYVMATLHWR